MGAGVRLPGASSPLRVDARKDGVADGQFAGGDADLVHDQAGQRALHVHDLGLRRRAGQAAGIAVLAAGFGIERGAVQDRGHDVALAGRGDRTGGAEQCEHPGLGGQRLPGQPLGRSVRVEHRPQRGGGGTARLALAGVGAGPLALPAHEGGEAVAVHVDALLGGHLQGQVDGEAVGVVGQEDARTGQAAASVGLRLGDGGVQNDGACRSVERKASSSASAWPTIRS
jgi:hypothetical protein